MEQHSITSQKTWIYTQNRCGRQILRLKILPTFFELTFLNKGVNQFYRKCRGHLKVISARRVTRSKFRAEILSPPPPAENLDVQANWHLGFLHPSS
jgi:hypothetical protein